MTWRRIIVLVGAAPLILTACSNAIDGQQNAPTSTKRTTTTTITPAASTTATTSAEPPVVTRTVAPAAAPTLVECIDGGGTWSTSGQMSDGTVAWAEECQQMRDRHLAAYPYQCPGSDQQVADLADCANAPRQTPTPLPPPPPPAPSQPEPAPTTPATPTPTTPTGATPTTSTTPTTTATSTNPAPDTTP